jgi:protein-tyrosine-phosphatase
MAEALARREIDRRKLTGWTAESAGIVADPGAPATPRRLPRWPAGGFPSQRTAPGN